MKTQLCWTIGNIAVDCSVCKATLVQLRCPQHIFSLLANLVRYYQQGHSGATSSSLIANLLWAMTNLVRGNIDVGYYAEFGTTPLPCPHFHCSVSCQHTGLA